MISQDMHTYYSILAIMSPNMNTDNPTRAIISPQMHIHKAAHAHRVPRAGDEITERAMDDDTKLMREGAVLWRNM